MTQNTIAHPKIVSGEGWSVARKEFLNQREGVDPPTGRSERRTPQITNG